MNEVSACGRYEWTISITKVIDEINDIVTLITAASIVLGVILEAISKKSFGLVSAADLEAKVTLSGTCVCPTAVDMLLP
jgi:hypothetical protein